MLIVAAIAAGFFVFYVEPQSQYERDRIYRSMDQVSRLIDDRTAMAAQFSRAWSSAYKDPPEKDPKSGADTPATGVPTELKELDQPGIEFGCESQDIICLSQKSENAAKPGDDKSTDDKVSFTLQSLAAGAYLPYPEAILLITDSDGHVLAGHDADQKWRQFQSLETLIRSPTSKTGKDPVQSEDLERLFSIAQRYGRGEENPVFEGYPARLSRDVGGQRYAIFVASHRVGRSLRQADAGQANAFDVKVVPSGEPEANTSRAKAPASGKPDTNANPAKAAAKGEPAADKKAPPDLLYFAYLVPESVIDRAALHISPGWTVNLLLITIATLLTIPFLKLFNQSPLKPIRAVDLAAVLIAIMLIVITATLLVSGMLLRTSVTDDIEAELAELSQQVRATVQQGLDARITPATLALEMTEDERKTTEGKYDPTPALAQIENAFRINKHGRCTTKDVLAGCGRGIWMSKAPKAEHVDISDRAYLAAWNNGIATPRGNFVQFLRAKSNGKLSWTRIEDVPGEALPIVVTALPLGLRAPILPRNFNFLIVLNSTPPALLQRPGASEVGDVQYASAGNNTPQSRSLIENLLNEARDDPELIAALRVTRSARVGRSTDDRSGLISINYLGRSQFAVVRPIAGTPWSVVAIFDRTELQGLLAQTVAQSFFLGCLWVLFALGACWLTPRILFALGACPLTPEVLREIYKRDPGEPPLRGRSLWSFPNWAFPNGVSEVADDKFGYSFETRADEVMLFLITLAAQTACLILLSPGSALLLVCVISLFVQASHYLLIVRPPKDVKSVFVHRIGIIMAVAIFLSLTLYVVTNDLMNWGVFLAASTLIALFFSATFLINSRDFVAGTSDRSLSPVRRAYLLRAMALLVSVVALPTMAMLTLVYTVNLKGYVGASLVTVAERIATQRQILNADLSARFVPGPQLGPTFKLNRFDAERPGWFLSTAGGKRSGAFSITVVPAAQFADSPAGAAQFNSFSAFTEAFTPHYASANSEVRDSAGQIHDIRGAAHTFVLADPILFEPFQSNLGATLEGKVLSAGPIAPFPLHPTAPMAIMAIAITVAFFGIFYRLLQRTATVLAGLNLDPETANKETRKTDAQAALDAKKALDALIEQNNPAAAWEAVTSTEQRARLVALALSRTINFSDRAPVQELIRNGYFALTPFIRIANPRLADYIRYDLPREERNRILVYCRSEDDNWEHMRMPVFVVLSVGCILIAYTSPGTVQLITSAFLALTALVPLTRDPLTRLLNVNRG